MKDDDIKILRKGIHELANKLMLIEKALQTYSKHLPPNNLTDLGNNAMEEVKTVLRAMREHIMSLESTNGKELPQKSYSLNQIRDGISFFRRKWESDYNLKVLIPDHIKYGLYHTTIDPQSLIEMIENIVEVNALSGASAVEISFNLDGEFSIDIHHNGKIAMPECIEQLEQVKAEILPGTVKLLITTNNEASHKLALSIPLAA